MIGQTVGSYRITARLGAGGMGEVYRATDTRLGRDVALKFSAEQFSERFEREARAVAALNHPNICTLYDVAPNYLVMELVEGITLAERIGEGPVPLDEALGVARQIAAALEEAHEKGITHRDLKPGNIKIKPDGTVKVLDFGLAKFVESAPTGGAATPSGSRPHDPVHQLTMSPTITSPAAMTYAGVILGTAAYMAPEQAKGKPVDKRADIWAFGVVLYEMVTGRLPFQGSDVGDVLASVIKEEPNWTGVPMSVRPLLQRCLEKEPKKRLRDISSVELLLEEETIAGPITRRRLVPAVAWAVAGALIAGVGFTVWQSWPKPSIDRPLIRLDVSLGQDVSLGSLRGSDVIISPDGERLAFVSRGRLWTRRLDQAEASQLAGSQAGYAPFFSPDGQSIAFFDRGKLRKVSIAGGPPTAIADATGFGGSWGTDGYIVASLDGRVLSRIPENGGTATPLTELTDGEIGHRWPQILPGGKAVLFTAQRSGADQIKVLSLADRRTTLVQKDGRFGRYVVSPDGMGYLVFENTGRLYGVRFDAQRLEVLGTPAAVVESVGSGQVGSGSVQFDVSLSGTLVYRSSTQTQFVSLNWIDASGRVQLLPLKPGTYVHPRLSPDGERVAMTVTSPNSQDIAVYDVRRNVLLPLTFGGANQFPVWTTDGRFIVFSTGQSLGGMSWTRADGASQPQVLTQSKNGQFPWSFSPDGRRLAFAEFGQGSGDIWTVAVEFDGAGLKAGKPEPFLRTATNELFPAFSPDGRWLAYRSFESGTSEIYVRAFPDTGGKWPISTDGGVVPIWSPVGNEFFYRNEDRQIMRVPYRANGDAFSFEPPRPWTEVVLADTSTQRNLDISPDGKRFVALLPADLPEAETHRNHVVFVQNFGEELQRRVGAGK
jgi:serine/threonine-protein kinase